MRRRQLVAVAVTTATAVVVALLVLRGPPAEAPAPPESDARSGPASVPTTGSAVEVAPPIGPPPRIGVLADQTYLAPGGARTSLRLGLGGGSGAVDVTPFDGGLLVSDDRFFEGTSGLHLATGGGAVTEVRGCTSGTGAASPDGRRVAWVEFSCPESGIISPYRLVVRGAHGRRTITPLRNTADQQTISSAVAFVGPDVVVNRAFGTVPSLLVGPSGIRELGGGSGVVVRDVAPDGRRLVGSPVGARDLRPTVVIDVSTGEPAWRSPRRYAGYSPDSSRLLGQADGAVEVVDAADGEPVARLSAPDWFRPRLGSATWEDEEHVLVVGRVGARTAVVRMGLDGVVEIAGRTWRTDRVTLIP